MALRGLSLPLSFPIPRVLVFFPSWDPTICLHIPLLGPEQGKEPGEGQESHHHQLIVRLSYMLLVCPRPSWGMGVGLGSVSGLPVLSPSSGPLTFQLPVAGLVLM